MNSIFHRVSIRKYKSQQVELDKIEQMLRAAMAAPSACNQQPWEFYVVTDKDVIAQLSEASPYAHCAKEAPVVFVPCYHEQGIAPDQKRMDAVRNVLHLPQKLHAFALVPCGYPAEERAQEDRFDVNRVHYIG